MESKPGTCGVEKYESEDEFHGWYQSMFGQAEKGLKSVNSAQPEKFGVGSPIVL